MAQTTQHVLLPRRSGRVNDSRCVYRRVRAGIILAGLTVSRVAERLKAHRTEVSNVIAGRRRTPRIQDGIARLIGEEPERLWGASYYARPKRPTSQT